MASFDHFQWIVAQSKTCCKLNVNVIKVVFSSANMHKYFYIIIVAANSLSKYILYVYIYNNRHKYNYICKLVPKILIFNDQLLAADSHLYLYFFDS